MERNLYVVVLIACFSSLALSAPSESRRIARRNIKELIDADLPRSVVPAIARPKRFVLSLRVKRSQGPESDSDVPTSARELQDSNNCIHKCWDDDDIRTEQVQTNFENKAQAAEHIGEDENSQKTQLSGVMNNLGSFMTDACQSAKKTKSCFQACPNSQLKDYAIADYTVEDVACEPDKNFGGYSNYRMSIFCINNTMSVSREYCSQQCHGDVKDLREVLQLGLDRNESDSSTFYVASSASQNVNTVRDQCKIITCTRDCSKNYLLKRCGQKGYDLYARQLVIEPRSTLTILQKTNSITSIPQECNSLK